MTTHGSDRGRAWGANAQRPNAQQPNEGTAREVGTMLSRDEVADAIRHLEALLALVQAGDLLAEAGQVDRLLGAVQALRELLDS